MPQIVIEPFDSAVSAAVQKINQLDPSLLKSVTKIIVHSGGGSGQLGHVEMGPGKVPTEVHIFRDRIKQHVLQNASVTAKKTLTQDELNYATQNSVIEVLSHEFGHIGGWKRTPEQIAKGPFFGEPEAEQTAKQLMQKIKPANYSFKISKRAAEMGMACPYCQENVSHIKPEKTPAGLFKMMTCPNCKNGFYPQDAMVSVKSLPKEKIEWNMPEKGWWGIWIGEICFGFVDGESKANLMMQSLVDKFAKEGIDSLPRSMNHWVYGFTQTALDDEIYDGIYPDMTHVEYVNDIDENKIDAANAAAKESSKQVESLLSGINPMFEKKRRQLFKNVLKTHKLPKNMLPSAESVITGGLPTRGNENSAAEDMWFLREKDPEIREIGQEGVKNLRKNTKEFVSSITNPIIKRYKAKLSGVDPSKLCDDEQSKKKVDEVIAFNRDALKRIPKIYGAISKFIKKFDDFELINKLAIWQHENNLELTGRLDKKTIKRLALSFSAPKSLPRNFAPVIPGLLYRGGLIMDESQLQALKDLGIQRVVSLHSNPDIPRLCNRMGVEHISAPIENGGPEDLGRKVFGNSVSSFLTEKPTYVHCFFGEDRTGGVIARFRTETGWPCELAYKEAKHYGFKDIFVDLIDWFSENCPNKPINTDKIRKALNNIEPYQNPEISPLKEQDCSLPTPAPDDVPFQDMEPTSFPSYKNYITSPIPTSISTVPLSIRSSIKIKAQEKNVEEDVEENPEESLEKSEADDIEPAVNIVGLQESEIEQNMNQSYTLEPFFSNIGNLG